MASFLKSLREPTGAYRVETADGGFFIVRHDLDQAGAFNVVARQALDRSGMDYVALPVSDGKTGYERIFIVPMD